MAPLEALDPVRALMSLPFRSGSTSVAVPSTTRSQVSPSTAISWRRRAGGRSGPEAARPDLLVLGALCHDIGKGRGGDHSVIGADLATQIGTRLGLWPSDVETLSTVVRYHLLLPDTATRKDLQDPATIAGVVDALDGDPVLLELLHALAEADSLATGPGVWGDWKASLIGDLVRRCRLVMAGEPLPHPDPVDPRHLELAADGRGVHVEMTPGDGAHIYNVTMIAPDRRGLLSKAAGVLALNSLRVHSASVNSHQGSAINTFVVSPHFGSPPAAELLRQQLILALDGDLDVMASLDKRDRDAAATTGRAGENPDAVPINRVSAPPRILWYDGAAPDELVVQIRATDRAGLLAVLTAVFERDGVDIAWAKVTTLGSSVVDAFCITVPPLVGTDRQGPRGRGSNATCTRCCPRRAPAKPVVAAG